MRSCGAECHREERKEEQGGVNITLHSHTYAEEHTHIGRTGTWGGCVVNNAQGLGSYWGTVIDSNYFCSLVTVASWVFFFFLQVTSHSAFLLAKVLSALFLLLFALFYSYHNSPTAKSKKMIFKLSGH